MMNEIPAEKNETMKSKRSMRFKIGVLFLVINTPIGYGGGILAAAIGVKMGKPTLGAGLGLGLYILSWSMLGLGIWMAGPEGVQLVKALSKKWFGRKKEPPGPAAPSAGNQ